MWYTHGTPAGGMRYTPWYTSSEGGGTRSTQQWRKRDEEYPAGEEYPGGDIPSGT